MNSTQHSAYPLSWPSAWPRARFRENSSFKIDSFGRVRDDLFSELRRLGARKLILSTNIPLRLDGLPYANFARVNDPGAAIYFEYKGKPMVFACDRWNTVTDNVHAIANTVAAIRGIERWGASSMLERAFAGFQALPAPIAAEAHWSTVLGVDEGEHLEIIEAMFREKMKSAHPDAGGSNEKAAELNRAIAEARSAKGVQL